MFFTKPNQDRKVLFKLQSIYHLAVVVLNKNQMAVLISVNQSETSSDQAS